MKKSSPILALDLLEKALRKKLKETSNQKFTYSIPSLWMGAGKKTKRLRVNPFRFYLAALSAVKRAKPAQREGSSGGEWTKNAIIYNMFVRTTTAFDHDGNGTLDLPLSN